MSTYDIFISYKRRGTSSATAAYIYDLLTKKGYSVFFDRKEMRNGSFNKQLYQHIENAKDILILLEEGSLQSCFSQMSESYKSDWFCMEIMHALQVRSQSTEEEHEKLPHIIPLLLDGYNMPEPDQLPDELKELPMQNAIPLDISEIDEFYKKWLIDKKYLASKPRNLYMSQMDGDGIADFLFYANGDCDIFEFGNLIGSINQNIDEEHPLKLPVKRSGEHRFRCRNNDTCEELMIRESIAQGDQKYVSISWIQQLGLWDLTEEDILREADSRKLYSWGKGLYDGTSKHEPDIEKSFRCLEKSASLWNVDARDFITDHVRGLDVKGLQPKDCIPWYEKAAQYGSADATEILGRCYDEGIGVDQDFNKALEYGQKALNMRLQASGKDNAAVAMSYHNLGRAYCALKQIDKSIESYNKALDIRIKLFGYNNKEVADTYNNLGLIYGNIGEYDKGLEYSLKALAIRETTIGADHHYTLASQTNIGSLYINQEKYAEGIQWYCKAAEKGYIKALRALADIYFKGVGVETDLEKAKELLIKAAEQGDDLSMNILAHLYSDELQNYDECFKWFSKSAENGNVNSMSNLGWCYQYGNGIEKNTEKAIEWYMKAVGQGDDYSMNKLAHIYSDELHNYDECFKWYILSAENGNTDSMNCVGECYLYGYGVEQDAEKAQEWYLKAAEQGDDTSMNQLAHLYSGKLQDYDECFKWFSKSAENGNVNSMSNLGWCYQYGNGIEKNTEKAIEWYMKAADQGDEYSMNKLAHLFFDELQDYDECFKWFSKSAENGNVNSMSNLGWCYQYGNGVEKNTDKAIEWYMKAAEQGNDFSMNKLAHLYSEEFQDFDECFKWFSKSAENGNTDSMACKGWCYHYGRGVKTDLQEALKWYEKSGNEWAYENIADIIVEYFKKNDFVNAFAILQRTTGHENAKLMNLMGMLYFTGKGVQKDYSEAFKWYSQAYEHNNITAAAMLELMYRKGKGVKKSVVKAKEYEKIIKSDTLTANNFNEIAWHLHLIKLYSEALPWAEKAVYASPDNIDIQDTLATVYQGLGYNDKAMKIFEKTLEAYKSQDNQTLVVRTEEKISAIKKVMAKSTTTTKKV